MDLELSGKVALVTGAGRGIGAAIAVSLAREGADVALVDLRAGDGAAEVAGEIEALHRRALVIEADVRDFAAAEAAVERTQSALGRLDVLVCNAGITRDGVSWKMGEDAWDDVLAVNLKGYFNYCRAAAGAFKAQGSGRIVTIASINGLRGKFGQANYAAAKGGGVALAKTLARELGRYGVTVNVVAPGMVETELARRLPADVLEKAAAETVVGRLASPQDVADAVVFLCSARARHITGEVIKVDGGQYI